MQAYIINNGCTHFVHTQSKCAVSASFWLKKQLYSIMLVSCQHRTPARGRNNSAGFSILCFRFRPIPNSFCENFASEHVVVNKLLKLKQWWNFKKKLRENKREWQIRGFVYRTVHVRSDAREGDTWSSWRSQLFNTIFMSKKINIKFRNMLNKNHLDVSLFYFLNTIFTAYWLYCRSRITNTIPERCRPAFSGNFHAFPPNFP